MIEIRSSFSRSFQLFVIFVLLAALAGAATLLSWRSVEASGLLLIALIAALFILVIVTYRMLARPVMFRLDEEGIFIRRLGLTVPWDAISRVEQFEYHDNKLFSLVEAEGGHPVFENHRIQVGAGVNDKLGLPPLVISMNGMQMDAEEFAELLSNSDEVVKFVKSG